MASPVIANKKCHSKERVIFLIVADRQADACTVGLEVRNRKTNRQTNKQVSGIRDLKTERETDGWRETHTKEVNGRHDNQYNDIRPNDTEHTNK